MLSIGLVGLPNVGKSTIFGALTAQEVLVADYPFATIEPQTGIVALPDERLEALAQVLDSQKVVHAPVTFIDIAGLVKNASQGEGLGNKFLHHIRETTAIAQVLRLFSTPGQPQPDDPQESAQIIATELRLADWQTLDNHRQKMKDKDRLEIVNQALKDLENTCLRDSPRRADYQALNLDLLSLKPLIYILNCDQDQLVPDYFKKTAHLVLNAKIEAEISLLSPEERPEFLAAYNLKESGLSRLIKLGFELLGLETFLTAGQKETRAWVIKAGSTARAAAGVIHTDFANHFIAAEVVTYQDLLTAKSWSAARAAGKVRLEGRDYRLQADDVVLFRANP